MPNKDTALTTQNTGFLATTDFSAMVAGELDGLDISFERIKIPAGGGIVFEIPGEDGETDTVKDFSAVILFHHPLNCFYTTKYSGGSAPPDCGSFDGVTGIGTPGGSCKSCPHNQFGSGENGSKACKNRRRIFLLREGELFPILLSLPTGSLKLFTKYLQAQLSKGRSSNSVLTKFSLKKATNTGGIAYSQAVFRVDRVLTAEEHEVMKAFTEQVKSLACNIGFDTENEVSPIVEIDEETGEILAESPKSDGDVPF